MVNTYTPFPPPNPDHWTKLPPGFIPPPPFHPTLKGEASA